MAKKLIGLIIFILILLMPNHILADEMKTIIIIVDELPFDLIEDLNLDKYNMGLVNLKGRPPYSREGLFLSINTGQKIELKDFQNADDNLEYLGDCLKEKGTSFIGGNRESLILVDKDGGISYREDNILYDLDWLVENTNKLLSKSAILGLAYDFNKIPSRMEILQSYLKYNNDKIIFILPQKIISENKFILNKYLVPIIYIGEKGPGLLTSSSTEREGLITIEDISVHIKENYGYFNNSSIGRKIEIIPANNPIKETINIYNKAMNLLIVTYIFHGIIYLLQIMFSIMILKTGRNQEWIYNLYFLMSTSILTSLFLGTIQLHKNLFIYLFAISLISLIITKIIINKKNSIFILSLLTYISIAVGIIFFPNIIYNSYIGYNNLAYGARYYGLNNGITAVLLVNSILIYYRMEEIIKSTNLRKLIGITMFTANIVILSTRFGANFGGFISSIILFGLMIYQMISNYRGSRKRLVYFTILVSLIIFINLSLNNINENSHLMKFLYRLKDQGAQTFLKVSYFKVKENLRLTIIPPFSMAIIAQVIILKKLKISFKDNKEIKNKAKIIIIIALFGFLLNDTGFIFLIYTIQYLILDLLNELKGFSKITPPL